MFWSLKRGIEISKWGEGSIPLGFRVQDDLGGSKTGINGVQPEGLIASALAFGIISSFDNNPNNVKPKSSMFREPRSLHGVFVSVRPSQSPLSSLSDVTESSFLYDAASA